jgi:hypothetical protein
MDGLNKIFAIFLLLFVVVAVALFIFARFGVLSRVVPEARLGFLTGFSARSGQANPTPTPPQNPIPKISNGATAGATKGDPNPESPTPPTHRVVSGVETIPHTGSPTLTLLLLPVVFALGVRMKN